MTGAAPLLQQELSSSCLAGADALLWQKLRGSCLAGAAALLQRGLAAEAEQQSLLVGRRQVLQSEGQTMARARGPAAGAGCLAATALAEGHQGWLPGVCSIRDQELLDRSWGKVISWAPGRVSGEGLGTCGGPQRSGRPKYWGRPAFAVKAAGCQRAAKAGAGQASWEQQRALLSSKVLVGPGSAPAGQGP